MAVAILEEDEPLKLAMRKSAARCPGNALA
jgi:hypothetical protein